MDNDKAIADAIAALEEALPYVEAPFDYSYGDPELSQRITGALASLRAIAPAETIENEWNKFAHNLVVNSTAMLASLHAANRHERPVAKTILQFETQAEALLDRWVELRQRGTPFDRALFIERLHVVDGSIVRESIPVEDTWKERSAPAPAGQSDAGRGEDAQWGGFETAEAQEHAIFCQGFDSENAKFGKAVANGIKALKALYVKRVYLDEVQHPDLSKGPHTIQNNAGRDGVIEECAKVADDFSEEGRFSVSDTWRNDMTPTQVYQTAATDVGAWIAKDIRALASAPSETVGSGELETEVEELRALVGKLNGGAEMQELMRLNNGLADKVRNLTTLLDQQLGTPCEQIRHAQEVERLQVLALSTADRDAIREALKLIRQHLIYGRGSVSETAAKAAVTAALALLEEG